jgi:tRNA nucleotidyltransferase (CCA-adding enzyme)
MIIPLPEDVQAILERLNVAGYSAFIVGGCVRDKLMGAEPKDWDIATSAKPHEVKAVFSHTADTGIQHGTVTVVLHNRNYELTTFRIDGDYKDGRRPENVTFTDELEEDLSRRDFTMNAIAYSPKRGLVDPFGGIKDIRRRNIRCVGHTASRFTEDALRMMRAVRFSAQLSFSIDPDTRRAITPLAERLSLVSIERVRDELTKILSSPNPDALITLEKTGLWPHVLRGLTVHADLRLAARRMKLCPKEPAMLYALFLSKGFTGHLKFDNRTIKECKLYINWIEKNIKNERYAVKAALSIIGPRQLGKLLTLKGICYPEDKAHWEAVRSTCENILESGECFCLKDLKVNGQDLINAGILPGKEMGRIMSALLDMVMSDPFLNEKEALIKTARDVFGNG